MQLDIPSLVADLQKFETAVPGFLAQAKAAIVKAEGSTILNMIVGRIVTDPKAAEDEILKAIDFVSSIETSAQGFIDPLLTMLLGLKPAPPVVVPPAIVVHAAEA